MVLVEVTSIYSSFYSEDSPVRV